MNILKKETPYLCYDSAAHKNNYRAVEKLVTKWIASGHMFERQTDSVAKGRYIIQDVPKEYVIQMLRSLKISRFSSSFDVNQISDFLSNCTDESISLFDIAFMDGSEKAENAVPQYFAGKEIYRVHRTCVIDRDTDRLNIGRRGKLGGPNDGLAGIVDRAGETSEEIVASARQQFGNVYLRNNGYPFDEKRNYPSDTWFKYVKNRKPLLMVYFIHAEYDADEPQQHNQIDELHQSLGDCPITGFMLGLPKNDAAAEQRSTKYRANKVYNWFEKDELDIGEDE